MNAFQTVLKLLRGKSSHDTHICPFSVLFVAADLWKETSRVFAAYAEVEACCFWYGTIESNSGRVTSIVIPAQTNKPGYYHVSADAMSAVSRSTRLLGWRNLAQIHTHPGAMVDHSSYDDLHANSQRALSLVLPHYGRLRTEWQSCVGIHEYQAGVWRRVSRGDAARIIVMTRTPYPIRVIDLR